MPTIFPPIDQSLYISGALLAHPLITQGMQRVRAVVPQALLDLPTSQQISFSDVVYPGGIAAAQKNCYWPQGSHCVQTTAANGWQPDVTACPDAATWGLSYDDGPTVLPVGPDTSDIRDNLNALGVKATFFVAGTAATANPDELRTSFQAGHEIAVHTWTHRPLTNLTNEQIVAEILYTEAKIYQTVGVVPRLFRPPYGDVDDRVRAIIGALGYLNVIWTSIPDRDSHDTGATNDTDRAAIVQTVETTWLTPQTGFISLNHDISNSTSAIAVQVLKHIQSLGPAFPLKLKTIGACLNVQSYVGVPIGVTPAAPAAPPTFRANPNVSNNAPAPAAGARQAGIVGSLTSGVLVVAAYAIGA
ncbi:chitin deacetylase [Geranomyces variabilis]|uniref:Chitin deacetylase n=1 Tax=Geranomyces variabilis TaxID=109894 RepID=A0AAD5TDD9_9FUNG|nr:chitin deacetylase [Geranomyces variabilis]